MTLQDKYNEASIIINEVKAMRTLQKSYFKSRWDDPSNSTNILNQSKLQERKVDQMIESFTKPKQPDLFG
jgi:hypothetical protein